MLDLRRISDVFLTFLVLCWASREASREVFGDLQGRRGEGRGIEVRGGKGGSRIEGGREGGNGGGMGGGEWRDRGREGGGTMFEGQRLEIDPGRKRDSPGWTWGVSGDRGSREKEPDLQRLGNLESEDPG